MISFVIWMAAFVLVIAAFFVHAKKSRRIEDASEDVASDALPMIGAIAERQHLIRFGRPPTETPGPPGTSVWYPPKNKRPA